MAGAGHGTKAVVAALLANLGIAVAKFVAFLLTGSGSMLAESVHSVADSGNQGLLLFGGRRAARAATPTHPFGYGRERYFWSFVVALILFSIGGMFAIYEGVEKLRHPHEIESAGIAIGVLVAAIAMESFSFRTAIVESNKVRGDASWATFVRRSKQPELPVVLLEDLGALLGLVFALAAVSLAVITDDTMWDGIGTLGIGVLLVLIAIFLAVEMKSLLIGESASDTDQRAICAAIASDRDVRSVIHLRTQHLGPDELLVAAKVDLDRDLDIEGVAAAIDRIEAVMRTAVPRARLVYIEPDLRRTRLAAPAT
jgi:cation diffusion facilitator family transporter